MPIGSNKQLLSVVMPVYNAEKSVERAVRSILDGTYEDFEFVIVDDGSADGTVDVIEGIGDDRIRLVCDEHHGLVAASNRAVAEAKGEVIARMDGDDFSRPKRLELQMSRFMEGGVDVVSSKVNIVDEDGEIATTMQRYEKWINEFLTHERIAAFRFVESPLVHPTVLGRQEVFEMGYREGPYPEDYDLWLRVIGAGYRVEKVGEVLLEWTESAERLTRVDDHYTQQAFDRCRRNHLLAGPLKEVKEVDLWGVGLTGKPWLRWLLEYHYKVRYVYEVDPGKVGQVIHNTPILHPDDMAEADGTPMVVAVGAVGARALIEPYVMEHGHRAGVDVWFVA